MNNTKYEIPRKYADLTIEFIRLFNNTLKCDWEESNLIELCTLPNVRLALANKRPLSYDYIHFVVFALEIAINESEAFNEEEQKNISTLLSYYSDLKNSILKNR